MGRTAVETKVVKFPRLVKTAPPDERSAAVIAKLQEWIERAQRGELRSVVLAGFTPAGASLTGWDCADGDPIQAIGVIEVMKHDLLASKE